MKRTLIASFAVVLLSSVGYGQVPAVEAGSAEAAQRLEEHRRRAAAQRAESGELLVTGLKVGARGIPRHIDAKVMQVIDENQMLVGIEDSRTGKGRYGIWVMLKCSTKGVTDGKFWRGGQWKDVAGSEGLSVTDTTTYTTAGGGTKTVFVVEPMTEGQLDELAKAARAAEDKLFRTWHSSDGKFSVEAKFLAFRDGKVHLGKRDGSTLEISPAQLSDADRDYCRELLKSKGE